MLAKIGSTEEAGVERTIHPGAKGATVFEIPMDSGILNQEGQGVDLEGGFWALNREKVDGKEKWIVYCRDVAGKAVSRIPEFCADCGRKMDEEYCSERRAADRNRIERKYMCR